MMHEADADGDGFIDAEEFENRTHGLRAGLEARSIACCPRGLLPSLCPSRSLTVLARLELTAYIHSFGGLPAIILSPSPPQRSAPMEGVCDVRGPLRPCIEEARALTLSAQQSAERHVRALASGRPRSGLRFTYRVCSRINGSLLLSGCL